MSTRSLSVIATLFALSLAAVTGCAGDTSDEATDAADGDVEGGGDVSEQDLTAAKTQKLKIGDTAHFPTFDVTLRKLVEGTDFEVGFDVKVCAKKVPHPVSWAPWGLKTVFGTVKATTEKDIPWHGTQLYPKKTLKVGECAEGIIPFINNDGETVTALTYHNSLGDTATWK